VSFYIEIDRTNYQIKILTKNLKAPQQDSRTRYQEAVPFIFFTFTE